MNNFKILLHNKSPTSSSIIIIHDVNIFAIPKLKNHCIISLRWDILYSFFCFCQIKKIANQLRLAILNYNISIWIAFELAIA